MSTEAMITEEDKKMFHPFEPVEKRIVFDGVGYRFRFSNGYEASVMRHSLSYGGNQGLWELAVLKDGKLCYDTPITDDVLGYLTIPEVVAILKRIQQLEPSESQ